MPLLIDAYNVLHVTGVLPPELAGIEVDGLTNLIQSSRYRDEHTQLVCDGKPPASMPNLRGLIATRGLIAIRYSGPGRSADDVITQLIHHSTAPRRLIVVSSDHAIQKAARKRRCKILASEEFLQQIVDDVHPHSVAGNSSSSNSTSKSKPPGGMSEAQLNRWIKLFNLDEKTLALESRGAPKPRAQHDDPTQSDATQPQSQPPANSESDQPPHVIKDLRQGQEVPDNLIEEAERLWRRGKKNEPRINTNKHE